MYVIPTYKDVICTVCGDILHGYDRMCNAQKVHKGKCRDTLRTNTNRRSSRDQYAKQVKSEPFQRKSARLIRMLEKAGIPVPKGTVILNTRWVRDLITMDKKRKTMARNALIKEHVSWKMYVQHINPRKYVGTDSGNRLLDYHTYVSSRGQRGCKWLHDGSNRAFCHVYMPNGAHILKYDHSADTFSFFNEDKPVGVNLPNDDSLQKRFPNFDVSSFRKYIEYVTPFVVEALDEVLSKKYMDHYSRPPWIEKCWSPNVWLTRPPRNPWSGCDGYRGNTCNGKSENDFPCHDVIDPNDPPRGYDGQRHPYTAAHYQYSAWHMPTWFDGIQKPVEPLPDDVSSKEIKTVRTRLQAWVKAQGRILKPAR